jgi:hypothetical protein
MRHVRKFLEQRQRTQALDFSRVIKESERQTVNNSKTRASKAEAQKQYAEANKELRKNISQD